MVASSAHPKVSSDDLKRGATYGEGGSDAEGTRAPLFPAASDDARRDELQALFGLTREGTLDRRVGLGVDAAGWLSRAQELVRAMTSTPSETLPISVRPTVPDLPDEDDVRAGNRQHPDGASAAQARAS